MTMLSDFLNEHSLSADAVAAQSKRLEQRNEAERDLGIRRETARRTKKSYEEAETPKPQSLGRGVGLKNVEAAMAGTAVPRLARKKITRAVNSLLTSAKKDAVDWRALFADTPSRKGKAPKGKKR